MPEERNPLVEAVVTDGVLTHLVTERNDHTLLTSELGGGGAHEDVGVGIKYNHTTIINADAPTASLIFDESAINAGLTKFYTRGDAYNGVSDGSFQSTFEMIDADVNIWGQPIRVVRMLRDAAISVQVMPQFSSPDAGAKVRRVAVDLVKDANWAEGGFMEFGFMEVPPKASARASGGGIVFAREGWHILPSILLIDLTADFILTSQMFITALS